MRLDDTTMDTVESISDLKEVLNLVYEAQKNRRIEKAIVVDTKNEDSAQMKDIPTVRLVCELFGIKPRQAQIKLATVRAAELIVIDEERSYTAKIRGRTFRTVYKLSNKGREVRKALNTI
jgi:hypothetical protein